MAENNLTELALVDAHGTALYRFCLRLTCKREDAEDLFQETFIRVFGLSDKWKKTENQRGFLLAVACHLWKSKRRKYARRERIAPSLPLNACAEQAAAGENTEAALLAREEAAQLRDLVNALPEHLKIPIVLHYTNELGVEEIAKLLRVPVGTVKSRLYAARKKLGKGMAESK